MKAILFASSPNSDIPANMAFINNPNATTDPGTTNDSTQGYSAGSTWTNTTGQRSWTCVDPTAGAAVWIQSGGVSGLSTQGAPSAQTTSALLTAANLLAKIITVLQGAGGASALQLPLATAMDTALPEAEVNDAIDFSLINISTTSAESASITTNTGWTLVGDMDVAANNAATTKSAGRFRARKTAAGAWTLYRIS